MPGNEPEVIQNRRKKRRTPIDFPETEEQYTRTPRRWKPPFDEYTDYSKILGKEYNQTKVNEILAYLEENNGELPVDPSMILKAKGFKRRLRGKEFYDMLRLSTMKPIIETIPFPMENLTQADMTGEEADISISEHGQIEDKLQSLLGGHVWGFGQPAGQMHRGSHLLSKLVAQREQTIAYGITYSNRRTLEVPVNNNINVAPVIPDPAGQSYAAADLLVYRPTTMRVKNDMGRWGNTLTLYFVPTVLTQDPFYFVTFDTEANLNAARESTQEVDTVRRILPVLPNTVNQFTGEDIEVLVFHSTEAVSTYWFVNDSY